MTEKDPLQEWADSDQSFAPPWRFDDDSMGPVLVGKIVSFSTAYAKTYGPHPVFTIEVEPDGAPYSVHVFHAALLSKLQQENPKVGDRIAIKQLGEQESASSGQTFMNYAVKLDRAGADSFYESLDRTHRRMAEDARKATADLPNKPEDPDLPF